MGHCVQLWMDDTRRGTRLPSIGLYSRLRELVYGAIANSERGDQRGYIP